MTTRLNIPIADLSAGALQSLIREFVLREGTDYGFQEQSLDVKINQVMSQLKNNKLLVVYSTEDESVNIISKEEFKKCEFLD